MLNNKSQKHIEYPTIGDTFFGEM